MRSKQRSGEDFQHGRPGAELSLGVFAYVLALIVLPLTALVYHGLAGGLDALWGAIRQPEAYHAVHLALWTAGLMAVINSVMGTATAWVLVRYRFPGRTFLSALVDLPFAVPTLVAGVLLVVVYGPQATVGMKLSAIGIRVTYTPLGIIVALLFITLPLVVRAVEPVLLEQDPAEEEAAWTLGASRGTIFLRILLPSLMPAILSGSIRSFARALGEFGSIAVISGNIPHRTLTASLYIYGEIESGSSEKAAAISIVLLAISLSLTFAARWLERRVVRRDGDAS